MTAQSHRPAEARDLTKYAPRQLLEWPDGRRWITTMGTLCFTDISGFTALSEKLAERGRIGAEELTAILDRVFGEMLDIANERGGSLLKFGGDALLLFFEGPDHAVQAASAAVEMRSVLAEVSRTPTAAGKLSLRMSQGLHSGEVMMVRADGSHSELILVGPSISRVMAAEHAAEPSEILVSRETRELLPPRACGERRGDAWPLRWRKARADLPGARTVAERGPAADPFVPVGLRRYLAAADPDPEHRLASVMFVKIAGIDGLLDAEGPDVVSEEIQRIVATVTEIADAEDITFLASDADVDGFKMILVAGVPGSMEDEEGRMLRAASRIAAIRSVMIVKVGVNRGHVFAGEVGTTDRATYTIIGDTVNTAARAMAAAPACVVYAGIDVVEKSRTLFETEATDPIRVKGKREPLRLLSLGLELGDRDIDDEHHGPLIGRAEQLRMLASGLDSVASSRGAWYRIVGETGFGKTRLMQEAVADVPHTVFQARAEPYGTANPYRSFRDPIRGLLGIENADNSVMAAALAARIESEAPHLVPFAPLVGDVAHIEMPPTPETDLITRKFRQARTADVVIDLIAALAVGPIVFTFDDAHWADPASEGLLDALAAAASKHPWVGIETARDGERVGATSIDLGPLEPAEIRDLIRSRTEAAPLRDDVIEALIDRAGGSPLFAEELLDALRSSGDIGSLPTSLEGVVGTQIDALNPLARRALRYVSVLGRSFRTSVARDLIATQGVQLDSATRTALSEFLIPDGGDGLKFYHAMVRDVAYSGLSFRLRRELHGFAGEQILRSAAGDDDSVIDTLAFHFYHSGDAVLAWEYCVRAGERNMQLYANPEAAVQFKRAIDVGKNVPGLTADEILGVYVKLGDVLERSGAFDDSIAAYRKAAKLTSGDVLSQADMRLKMARARERAGKYASALGDTTRAIRLVEAKRSNPAKQRRAEALGYAALIRQAQQKPHRALVLAQEAATLAAEIGDDVTLARSWVVLDWAYFMVGRPSEAVYSLEALKIYEQRNDLNQVAIVATNIGGFAFFEGEWKRAVEFYEKGRDAADEAGNKIHAALSSANIGEVFVLQGRGAEAIESLASARRISQASGFTEGIVFADLLRARAFALEGELEEAKAIASTAKDEAANLGLEGWKFEASILIAELEGLLGDTSEALRDLKAAQTAAPGVYRDHYEILYIRTEATVLAVSGDIDGSLELIDRAIEIATARGDEFERSLAILTRRHVASHLVEPEEAKAAMRSLDDLGVVSAPLALLANA